MSERSGSSVSWSTTQSVREYPRLTVVFEIRQLHAEWVFLHLIWVFLEEKLIFVELFDCLHIIRSLESLQNRITLRLFDTRVEKLEVSCLYFALTQLDAPDLS